MKPNLQEISFSVDKLSGLTDAEITKSRFEHGANVLKAKAKRNIFQKVLHVLMEPMFLLLFGAASIYFLVGEVTDGVTYALLRPFCEWHRILPRTKN